MQQPQLSDSVNVSWLAALTWIEARVLQCNSATNVLLYTCAMVLAALCVGRVFT